MSLGPVISLINMTTVAIASFYDYLLYMSAYLLYQHELLVSVSRHPRSRVVLTTSTYKIDDQEALNQK